MFRAREQNGLRIAHQEQPYRTTILFSTEGQIRLLITLRFAFKAPLLSARLKSCICRAKYDYHGGWLKWETNFRDCSRLGTVNNIGVSCEYHDMMSTLTIFSVFLFLDRLQNAFNCASEQSPSPGLIWMGQNPRTSLISLPLLRTQIQPDRALFATVLSWNESRLFALHGATPEFCRHVRLSAMATHREPLKGPDIRRPWRILPQYDHYNTC